MFKKLPVRLFLIKLPAILSLLLTLSCSDFTGSKGPNRATEKPAEKPTQGGKNPFPAGFDPFQQPFSEEKMLATIGTSVLYPASREFRLNLENLQIDIQKLMAELRRSKADPLTLQSVQQSWKKAMLAFHYLDAAPLGPLTNRGRYLIDNIYSWPRFNPCGIDLEVAQLAATGAGNKNLLFTLKGLNALEYLFFSDSSGSYCNRNNQSHKAAFDWLTKSDIQRRADRAAYAEWIMPELVRMARELEQGWDPNEGHFFEFDDRQFGLSLCQRGDQCAQRCHVQHRRNQRP